MVFEDESSDDESSLPYMHSFTSSTDGLYQILVALEDPYYKRLELYLMVFCEKHGKASKIHVAFEGTDTGRRFLACLEPSNLTYQQQCRCEVVADMKGQMAKKDADHQHLNDKYQLLVNLTRSQATIIHNLKLKHMKEKQVHSEAMMKLELKNAELTKSEEKLTQEKLKLKFQIVDLLMGKEVLNEEKGQLEHQIAELMKGYEKHIAERGQLELQIAEMMKGEEKLKLKLKGILVG
ncbi:hypothetical protein ZWY2020_031806 [Hordeum vulgare]|nr:hypothetical protein ZWY2020_031806 [Hordeum vulgare]